MKAVHLFIELGLWTWTRTERKDGFKTPSTLIEASQAELKTQLNLEQQLWEYFWRLGSVDVMDFFTRAG